MTFILLRPSDPKWLHFRALSTILV